MRLADPVTTGPGDRLPADPHDHNRCDVCDSLVPVDEHRCEGCDWLLEEHGWDPVALARLAVANAEEANRLRAQVYRGGAA